MSKPDDPWSGIPASSSQQVGRRIEDTHALAIFWVLSAEGAPGILFRDIDPTAIPRQLPRPRGVAVVRQEGPAPQVALFLLTPEHREVFLTLCRDVVGVSGAQSDPTTATLALFRRLSHWQAMLRVAAPTEMGPNEVRGLMAELWVLDALQQRCGMAGALRAWVAPNDHPQDFSLGGGIIEVKARLAGSRPWVSISSLEQLEPGHLPLHLMVVELASSDAENALTLNTMVEALSRHAAEETSALEEELHEALLRRGYIRSPRYDELRYAVSGARSFLVGEGFPRLTRSQADRRIATATYCIDLTGIGSFEREVDDTLSAVLAA